MSFRHTLHAIADTARISVATLAEAARGPLDPEVLEARLDGWSAKLLRDAGVTLEVRGRENAGRGGEALVVMSNHQSHYDIPVLYQSVPGPMRMVAKAELFRVPVWGRAMRAAGFLRVDRSDRQQAIATLRTEGAALLARGTRLWIAPEGTRSRDGKLLPFKSGGFRLALDLGVRILPVAIAGTREVLPAKGAVVHPGHRVTVTILPPIDPTSYGVARRKELMTDVRRAIEGALASAARTKYGRY